ncbi:unnamed protein product [Trichogramma brassicae]|uniref:Uncharacterized protein n=1 Tax=Trichogramma brassicae TaxID=86971 RepID=A0A6H5IC22_9HYME|nr:unnamed protein product [Trichogramma brassicae]
MAYMAAPSAPFGKFILYTCDEDDDDDVDDEMYCVQSSWLTKTQDSWIFPAAERRTKKLRTRIKLSRMRQSGHQPEGKCERWAAPAMTIKTNKTARSSSRATMHLLGHSVHDSSHIHARKNTLENERELKVKISLLKKGGQAVQNAKLKKKNEKKNIYTALRDELSASSSWATDVFERFAAVHAWQQIELHLEKLESRKMKNRQRHRIAHINGARGAFAKKSQSRTTTTTQVSEQRVSFFSPRRAVWPECCAFRALHKLDERGPTTAIAAA